MDTITALALAFTWIGMIAAGLYFQSMVKTILTLMIPLWFTQGSKG